MLENQNLESIAMHQMYYILVHLQLSFKDILTADDVLSTNCCWKHISQRVLCKSGLDQTLGLADSLARTLRTNSIIGKNVPR
jgi:hypothetical protein